MNANQIIEEITSYITGEFRYWYAGIASNAEQRLFVDHAVERNGGRWVYCPADSENSARVAESALHERGFDGDSGGGDSASTYVYAYLKGSHTRE
jgi:hypothetical protein